MLVGLAAAACAPAASDTATPTAPPPASATPTATFTASPPPSATMTATATLEPSATATASATASPSATPTPSEAPSATPTATSAPTNTQPPASGFAPTARSRWNTTAATVNSSGSCSTSVTAPYGPVIINPNANGSLGWINTANEDYTLARLGQNVYQYSGPTTRGDGAVTIDVSFTSATSFNMTRVFAPSAEAGCTYSYFQTGTFEFVFP